MADSARAEDAEHAPRTPFPKCAHGRELARAASDGAARVLSWAAFVSAIRSCMPPACGARGNALLRSQWWHFRCFGIDEIGKALLPGRESWRGRDSDYASSEHDSCRYSARNARCARHP